MLSVRIPRTFHRYMGSSDWGSTRRVAAQVTLADDLVVEGDLHLMARSTYPPGPESPLEMLNRREPFFALIRPDGGVRLVSKARIVMVSCYDEVSLLEPDRASVAIAVELAVQLHDGTEHRGRATFELPLSSARLLDYLNEPGAFFALGDGDTIRYINKSFVRLIRPLD